ncbi:2-polyprenyl-6-methoxyphenol hydroxylase-like FAD-dependent oxidoreductase [Actinokineospora baliensis]|uniref:FAD-dependent oxidoreductase n=1 Tax=Actinokineospora baliensis TaxID=547056 RepID=UPI00195651DC|nr:FAD-dependent monooxygenase [Actinokineospora baliensis]MBM7774543.1 2-polyprenyl-6-methoxyphenol hydroxylase-like FAD-dependent oxidoreductase [Actinokineospora baliensis]
MGHDTRAVVLGAGMAGLLAARVLAEVHAQVLIVDRDRLTGVGTARRGVPQGRHVHGLLARGQQILDELFPGFTEAMVADGVPTADLGELRWFFNGRKLEPGTTGLTAVAASRPTLERYVRTRVAALPQVRFVEETDIVGLVTTDDRTRVTGVRVQAKGGQPEVLDADLVVDTTGRGSRTPLWLAELGYERPDEERVKIDLTYTTRTYRLADPAPLRAVQSINPVSGPVTPRGAFLTIIENDLCALSLTGVLGDAAPTDPDGFLEFARSLPVPDVYDTVKDAEPLDDPVSHRYVASQRRRYERLDRFPDRLLVLGDAACSFNPVYGQGMTVAAQQALVLREHLAGGVVDPLAFLRDIAEVVEVPWGISAAGDLAFPEVEGPRPQEVLEMNAFMAKLQLAATVDGAVTRSFMRVAGLVDPVSELTSPEMVTRVLDGAGRVAAVPA